MNDFSLSQNSNACFKVRECQFDPCTWNTLPAVSEVHLLCTHHNGLDYQLITKFSAGESELCPSHQQHAHYMTVSWNILVSVASNGKEFN